ncbi:MAG: putative disease resistance protein Aig2 [Linnemannia elongata]|nr:MAG: putative disease resistance protein Aig2 [Linnemannia elongata]
MTDPYPCFFYGSLMSTRVLNSVTRPGPEANLHTVPATIQGYVRYPYHNEPYPGMIASKDDPTSIVEGLLVFGHSLMDRFRLDQFEGSEYTREILPIKVLAPVPGEYNAMDGKKPLAAGDVVKSYVYVFTGPHVHLDQSRLWDYEAFKRDHLDVWMNTSSDFV